MNSYKFAVIYLPRTQFTVCSYHQYKKMEKIGYKICAIVIVLFTEILHLFVSLQVTFLFFVHQLSSYLNSSQITTWLEWFVLVLELCRNKFTLIYVFSSSFEVSLQVHKVEHESHLRKLRMSTFRMDFRLVFVTHHYS